MMAGVSVCRMGPGPRRRRGPRRHRSGPTEPGGIGGNARRRVWQTNPISCSSELRTQAGWANEANLPSPSDVAQQPGGREQQNGPWQTKPISRFSRLETQAGWANEANLPSPSDVAQRPGGREQQNGLCQTNPISCFLALRTGVAWKKEANLGVPAMGPCLVRRHPHAKATGRPSPSFRLTLPRAGRNIFPDQKRKTKPCQTKPIFAGAMIGRCSLAGGGSGPGCGKRTQSPPGVQNER